MRINKIEIAVAIVIISSLVFLTVYKCLSVLEQSKEIATKKGLSSLRNAIAIYYSDNSGRYPDSDISKEIVEKGYIEKIPYVYIPHHKKSNQITIDNLNKNTDSGGWAYKVDDTPDSNGRTKGQIWINCSHGDWSKL
jgi:type II secretory pathway pseudopilin PulG